MQTTTPVNHTDLCRNDAIDRYLVQYPKSYLKKNNIVIKIHEQLWNNSNCGAGGIGLCSTTTAPTVVVAINKHVYVYIGATYAYDVNTKTMNSKQRKAFDEAYTSQTFPGRSECDLFGAKINNLSYSEHIVQHPNGLF